MATMTAERWEPNGRKRILSLDGGGVRGALSLGVLESVERLVRERLGREDARLCDYFDLIAGTSTGSIIAAGLALGMSVEELSKHYRTLGTTIFEKRWYRFGVLWPKYSEKALSAALREILGETTTLGDEKLKTGLMVITKRLDTSSVWPLTNNPRGPYYGPRADAPGHVPNKDYRLWQVIRASTAAPHYFSGEKLNIDAAIQGSDETRPAQVGVFVDGGASPHNNPALQALLYVCAKGYGIGWETGDDKLLIVSVGTGRKPPVKLRSFWYRLAAGHAGSALVSVLDDNAQLVETMLQWNSEALNPRIIDGELGTMAGDLLAKAPLFSYLRYDADLTAEALEELGQVLPPKELEKIGDMDRPENIDRLFEIGRALGKRVATDHFPRAFDPA